MAACGGRVVSAGRRKPLGFSDEIGMCGRAGYVPGYVMCDIYGREAKGSNYLHIFKGEIDPFAS